MFFFAYLLDFCSLEYRCFSLSLDLIEEVENEWLLFASYMIMYDKRCTAQLNFFHFTLHFYTNCLFVCLFTCFVCLFVCLCVCLADEMILVDDLDSLQTDLQALHTSIQRYIHYSYTIVNVLHTMYGML